VIRQLRFMSGCLLSLVLASAAHAQASAKVAAELLPNTTKGFLSVPNMDECVRRFEATEIGKLARDPVMKPFADDLQAQLRTRFGNTTEKLGINWDDLQGAYHGEASLALIQPDNDPKKHAVVMLVDTADEKDKLPEILRRIDDTMSARKATKKTGKVGSTALTVYELPRKKGQVGPREAIVFTLDRWFAATDDQATAAAIIHRYQQPQGSPDSLANLAEYKTVMSNLAAAAGPTAPHVQWFVEPFPYAQIVRAATSGARPHDKQMLEIFRDQGFDAVRGVGGFVSFATGDHEVLHRTFVHAPADEQAPPGSRYRLAARMLDFPNGKDFEAPNWVPQTVASYSNFNWKLRESFENSITLVDAIVNAEGFVEKVLESIRTDPNGPKIDLRKALINRLGTKVLVMSDYALPISPKSERLLFAAQIDDAPQVAAALETIFKDDPLADRRVIDGHTVWEIRPEEDEELEELKVNFGNPAADDEADEEPLKIPNSAVTVEHNYLLAATSIEFLASVLNPLPTDERITANPDFQAINDALAALGADAECCRFFARTDVTYRASYELIRQGKMPEAETVLGRLLNRLLGPEEEGVLRKQRINGQNLPPYEVVGKHLGPAGLFVRTLDEGWMMTGLTLKPTHGATDESGARVTSRSEATLK